jgi:hypothetical protein
MHTVFVGDFGARVSPIAERGLEVTERRTYADSIRRASSRDRDGNEIGRRANLTRDGTRRGCYWPRCPHRLRQSQF